MRLVQLILARLPKLDVVSRSHRLRAREFIAHLVLDGHRQPEPPQHDVPDELRVGGEYSDARQCPTLAPAAPPAPLPE